MHSLVFLLLPLLCFAAVKHATVLQRGITPADLTIVDGLVESPIAVCTGLFDDDVHTDGFSKLRISCYEKYHPSLQFAASGLVEGYLTQLQIAQSFNNTGTSIPRSRHELDVVLKFFRQHLDFVNHATDIDPNLRSAILNVHLQAEFLATGYLTKCKVLSAVEAVPLGCSLSKDDVILLNFWGDLQDYLDVLFPGANHNTRFMGDEPFSRCSSLLYKDKLSGEIYFGHCTWDSMSAMLRTMKRYELNAGIGGKRVAVEMSSQPGTLWSYDDWYVTSEGLLITETTNNMLNDSLLPLLTYKSLWTSEKAITASYLAATPAEWVNYFISYNSGTYNCQWQVLDLKNLGTRVLPTGTFYILELMPGIYHFDDFTSVVNTQGYFPSFNVPLFPDVYEASGYGDWAKEKGDDWTWAKSPRHLVFKRDVSTIKDFDSFNRVLRQNKYKSDPLLKGDPSLAISARYDLRSTNAKCAGAIDVKSFKSSDLKTKRNDIMRLPHEKLEFIGFHFIAGPTYQDDAPVFDWRQPGACSGKPHYGQPLRFDFEWTRWF
ncbi:hypothetical protein RCL1_004692 [Eukaryota sp. TZLM3-RCL]